MAQARWWWWWWWFGLACFACLGLSWFGLAWSVVFVRCPSVRPSVCLFACLLVCLLAYFSVFCLLACLLVCLLACLLAWSVDWVRLAFCWVGLCGLGWVGLGWVGLGWVGLGWVGFRLGYWLVGRLVGWSVGWLVGGLVGWWMRRRWPIANGNFGSLINQKILKPSTLLPEVLCTLFAGPSLPLGRGCPVATALADWLVLFNACDLCTCQVRPVRWNVSGFGCCCITRCGLSLRPGRCLGMFAFRSLPSNP